MRTLWCTLIFCIALSVLHAQSDITLRGIVKEADTNTALRFVSVRVLESRTSTMTDKRGAYVLRLRRASVPARDTITVVYSLVGYAPDTVHIPLRDATIDVSLKERAFTGAEVVVTAEDPAVAIMRRVLARKNKQRDSLQRYTYTLYTKFIVNTDTSTASRGSGRGDTTTFSILESFSNGYFSRPDRYFNEIIQRRQTANIPPQANFVSFGTNLNAYDDVVTLLNEEIQSPLHPNAIDDYEFILKSSIEDDTVVIDVRSSGDGRRAFNGTIFIDQRANVPLEMRLVPNKAVNLPFDASLQYRQRFVVIDGVVVPEALSLTTSFVADIVFLFSPRLDIDIETFCYDYVINADIDESIFEQRRVEINEQANAFDSTYWRVNQKLPLRAEEAQAYADIQNLIDNPDSLQATFLDNYIGPITRTLARLDRRPFSGFEDIIRYNRITGLYVGAGLRFRPDTAVELEANLGYGTLDKRGYGSVKSTFFLGERQKWSLDASLFSNLQRRDDPNIVRTGLITATTFLFGNDYGDYYRRAGGEFGAGYSWGQLRFIRNDLWLRPSGIRLFVRSEDQSTAVASNVWSVFRQGANARDNPAIFDGTMRSLGMTLRLDYTPQRLITRTGMMLNVETSQPTLLPSAFTFTKATWIGVLRMKTLPLWTLDVVGTFGWGWGDVPPQRFSSLESSVSGLVVGSVFRGMSVKEFYGDRYATVSISHNFGEVIPGILRIPDIASFGIEFILFGGVGWTAFRSEEHRVGKECSASTAFCCSSD
ncbi:MAG: DUF5686 family protein [Candidatus Kapabacteria bacterium]|nr:DUF5686 family protein [Candidatus Kapabacteria bacterium]